MMVEPPALPAYAGAWERAEAALARLDERVRDHPLREGWLARAALAETAASAALEGAYLNIERIALWETDVAHGPADQTLTVALGILRAWRALARVPVAEVLEPDGIVELHGRTQGTSVSWLRGDGPHGDGPRGGLSRDEDDENGPDRIARWLEYLETLERTPALIAAGLALAAWHRIGPVRHGGPTGRLLTTAYLWRRRKTQGPVAPIARGFREALADYRPFDPPDRWLRLFLEALTRGTEQGLRDLGSLTLARERLMAHCGGHRRNSRMDQVAGLLLDRPAASPGDVARAVGMTRRGAVMLLEQLVTAGAIEEVSGRERFKVYRVR